MWRNTTNLAKAILALEMLPQSHLGLQQARYLPVLYQHLHSQYTPLPTPLRQGYCTPAGKLPPQGSNQTKDEEPAPWSQEAALVPKKQTAPQVKSDHTALANPDDVLVYDFASDALRRLKGRKKVQFDRSMLVLLIPALVSGILGYWQLERKTWKDELIRVRKEMLTGSTESLNTITEYPREYQKVRMEGEFMNDKTIFIGPRVRTIDGKTENGYVVVTPMFDKQSARGAIVNRGWVPRKYRHSRKWRKQLDEEGRLSLNGIVRPGEKPSVFVAKNQPEQGEWFWLDPAGIAEFSGFEELTPMFEVIRSDDLTTMGYSEVHMNPLTRIQRELSKGAHQEVDITYPVARNLEDYLSFSVMPGDHLNYAATWFSLAVILAIYAVAYMRKPRY